MRSIRRGGRGALSLLRLSWILPVIFILVPFSAAREDRISLSVEVDKTRITIGDLITYQIHISREEGVEIIMPSLGENLGQFEIRDYTVFDPRRKDHQTIDRIDYVLSTFEVGEFTIPPVEIRYRESSQGLEGSLKTDPIKIIVESVKPSEQGDIREIKPPREITAERGLLVILIVVGAGIVTAVITAWILIRKRRGMGSQRRASVPARPPHEWALEALGRLRDSGLPDRKRVKEFYSEISEILRRYVEARYHIPAMELTSQELLDSLQPTGVMQALEPVWERLTSLWDWVKFAKLIPSEEDNRAALESAFRIVEETRPRTFPETVVGENGEVEDTPSEGN